MNKKSMRTKYRPIETRAAFHDLDNVISPVSTDDQSHVPPVQEVEENKENFTDTPVSKESTASSSSSSTTRKPRSTYSFYQVSQLKKRFRVSQYLSPPERINLANELQLTPEQVKIWFQNFRSKVKRACSESDKISRVSASSLVYNSSGVNSHFPGVLPANYIDISRELLHRNVPGSNYVIPQYNYDTSHFTSTSHVVPKPEKQLNLLYPPLNFMANSHNHSGVSSAEPNFQQNFQHNSLVYPENLHSTQSILPDACRMAPSDSFNYPAVNEGEKKLIYNNSNDQGNLQNKLLHKYLSANFGGSSLGFSNSNPLMASSSNSSQIHSGSMMLGNSRYQISHNFEPTVSTNNNNNNYAGQSQNWNYSQQQQSCLNSGVKSLGNYGRSDNYTKY